MAQLREKEGKGRKEDKQNTAGPAHTQESVCARQFCTASET